MADSVAERYPCGMVHLLHLGILAAFVTATILFAPRFFPKIKVKVYKPWAPLVGLAYAAVQVSVGWLLAGIVAIVTLGLFGFVGSFATAVALLYALDHYAKDKFDIQDIKSLLYLAAIFSVANGVLRVVL